MARRKRRSSGRSSGGRVRVKGHMRKVKGGKRVRVHGYTRRK